jgi:hypothetical protein
MKLYLKIALFVVSFIAISAILAALYMFNLNHTDMSRAKPDFIITASALQKDFEVNETAASSKFMNKILEVSGPVISVTPAGSNINISLKTGSDISSVLCTFTTLKKHSDFKSGDEITVRGQCSGFLVDVLLNNCAIIMK